MRDEGRVKVNVFKIWRMSFLLGTFLQSFHRNVFTLLNRFRNIFYKLLVVLLTSSVILWLSVFLYGTFYYAYMPVVSHTKPVHLQFRWVVFSFLTRFLTIPMSTRNETSVSESPDSKSSRCLIVKKGEDGATVSRVDSRNGCLWIWRNYTSWY